MKMIENLEHRQLMSTTTAMLDGGDLFIMGDENVDTFTLQTIQVNGEQHIRLTNNGQVVHIDWSENYPHDHGDSLSVPASAVDDIEVQSCEGDDVLTAVSSGAGAVTKPITWIAGEGNDTIRPGAGKDEIEGDDGIDTVDYSKYAAGVEVYLNNNSPDASGVIGSLTDRDQIDHTVENVKGGKGNDILVGNDLANKMWGGAGNDTITGKGGADKIFGEAGNDKVYVSELFDVQDQVDGGDGRDILYGKMRFDIEKNFEFHG